MSTPTNISAEQQAVLPDQQRALSAPVARAAPMDEIKCDDCLRILQDLPASCIDFIYLDPPFHTGKMQSAATSAYDDRWPNLHSYLAFMHVRLQQIQRVLRPTGSIMLHCDWRTSHHFRIMLDELFGSDHFINHVIWTYGLGGSSPRRFARKHDDILFYGCSDQYYFDPPMIPASSRRMAGQTKKATDVLDIPAINNMAVERLGYPTQKPLALLKLLVAAACPPQGIVLDPFCGSGTTLEAARQLDRSWLGIDSNPQAVELARTRLARCTD